LNVISGGIDVVTSDGKNLLERISKRGLTAEGIYTCTVKDHGCSLLIGE
jgi:hypothetical protein